MQKPILSPFRLGSCGPITLIAIPDTKNVLYSPNQGVLSLKVFDNDRPESDLLQPIHLPAVATEEQLFKLVVSQLTHDFFWGHFFPGLSKSDRSYLFSAQSEEGKLRLNLVIGSIDALKKINAGTRS